MTLDKGSRLGTSRPATGPYRSIICTYHHYMLTVENSAHSSQPSPGVAKSATGSNFPLISTFCIHCLLCQFPTCIFFLHFLFSDIKFYFLLGGCVAAFTEGSNVPLYSYSVIVSTVDYQKEIQWSLSARTQFSAQFWSQTELDENQIKFPHKRSTLNLTIEFDLVLL